VIADVNFRTIVNKKTIIVTSAGALVGCAIILICWSSFRLYRVVKVGIPEAYAAWTTADLIIDHMQAHGGEWPTGWELLNQAAVERLENGRALRCEAGRLPELVSVNWEFDPKVWIPTASLVTSFKLRVVTRRDGTEFRTVWHGAEPNEMISDFLLTGKRKQ